jgi:hypothetical protein
MKDTQCYLAKCHSLVNPGYPDHSLPFHRTLTAPRTVGTIIGVDIILERTLIERASARCSCLLRPLGPIHISTSAFRFLYVTSETRNHFGKKRYRCSQI